MYKKEEEQLNEYKKIYDQIPVSLQSIDDAILAGYQRAKFEGKQKPKRKKWLFSLAATALLLIGFFTTIRLSPAFANYITVIPGMERVVELIRHDKGIMLAIENDYYQKLGASEEKSGIQVTIDGAIADEDGMVLFYNVRSKEKYKNIYVDNAFVNSINGEKLNLSSASFGSTYFSFAEKSSYNGTLEYYYQTPFKTKELELSLEIKGDISEKYKIPFTLVKDIKQKKTYELNKTVEIAGQKVTFISAIVQPLRVAVHVKKDPNNTKKLLNFDDLRLVDENGESWNKITNGTTASKISDDEEIIYLQSNYFRQPKELYLALNKVQAVDKGEEYVVVDVEQGEILKQPKGNLLKSVKVSGSYIDFTMAAKKDFPYFLFSEIKDGKGNEIQSESSFSRGLGDEEEKSFGVNIPGLKNQEGPISLKLSFFPSWIEDDVKIKIN
ncbi:DUF4179 domain-containing protein [Bacillus sp. CGMCC 1.16607]|uniref:DUF4179 domain-containing protein n=1 Tax=Bacillus sp. CGMCC 1.16607 TaxID=3351842 RepID=UPI00363466A0